MAGFVASFFAKGESMRTLYKKFCKYFRPSPEHMHFGIGIYRKYISIQIVFLDIVWPLPGDSYKYRRNHADLQSKRSIDVGNREQNQCREM